MKYIGKIIGTIVITFVIFGCNPDKRNNVKQIKTLTNKVDSLHEVYYEIDFDSYKKIQAEMNENLEFLKKHSATLASVDEGFIAYFGPYSTSYKILSRIFKKKTTSIESELILAKKQVGYLLHDVKNNYIAADSIGHYITVEQTEVNELLMEMNSLVTSLEQQKIAYEATNDLVNELVNKVKAKNID